MPRTKTLQSTNRNVCSRRSTMHPVRPGGTRTTDSSSPMALVDPSIGGVDRAGRRLPPPTAAWDEHMTDGCSSAANRSLPHRRACPYGDRSIRPPGAPLTYSRSEIHGASAANPLFTLFPCWTERVLRGTCRSIFRRHLCLWNRDHEGARFASVIDTTCEHEAVAHHPRSTRNAPWPGPLRIYDCERLEVAP